MSKPVNVIACAECSAPMVLRDSKYGRFYGCTRYPACKGTHGAHQATGKPLGAPADKRTKAARIRAHDAFDVIWKEGYMSRNAAYRWLRHTLGITKAQCHIGLFDVALCNRVVALCTKYAGLREAINAEQERDA